jgi:hypothetical protein
VTTGEQGQNGIVEGSGSVFGAHQLSDTPAPFQKNSFQLIDETDTGAGAFDVTTMLELSLFLMLLTFFLVLTANSSFDDRRVGSVIGGVQSAFGVQSGGRADDANDQNGAALLVMQSGARPATGAYAAKIEDAFATVGGARSQVHGDSFNMVLSENDLFVEGSAAIKADQRALFSEIGPLLQISDQQRHVVALVPSAPTQRLDVRRAASIARLLLQDGAPAGQIAVGVKNTDEEFVTFRFFTLPGRTE